jgi:molecular chaperone GrpE
MTEDQGTPDPARREAGEGDESTPRFSFTDKRKVDPADGSVRPQGQDAASAADPAGEGATAPDPEGTDPVRDPIDAEAAELFDQAAEQAASGSGESDRVSELEGQVADLTEELKRAQAEYVNSRRRLEGAAQAETQAAVGKVLASLISVLDDIELGRQHGDIVEGTPFHSIAGKLEETLRGHGLERYGQAGDAFDPNLHEALMHQASADAQADTVTMVMQPGYKVNDRVLRPARVATEGPE